MMKLLLNVNGHEAQFDLAQRPVILGRAETCDLQVQGANSETVSARHAILKLINGQLTIEDLGSSNGTYVNEQRLQGVQSLNLSHDRVRLGRAGPWLSLRLIEPAVSQPDVHRQGAAPVMRPEQGLGRLEQKGFVGNPLEIASQPSPADRGPASPSNYASAPKSSVSPDDSHLAAGPSTRQLLIRSQKLNIATWIITASVGLLVVGIGGLLLIVQWIYSSRLQQEVSSAKTLQTDLYRTCALSTALIVTFVDSQSDSRGTGFLLDRDKGYLVTNHHVIEGADAIAIWFPELRDDGSIENRLEHYYESVKPMMARMIYSNPSQDLALLQIDFEGRYPYVKPLQIASEVPPNGSEVYTFGNPGSVQGVGWTFSDGVVKNFVADFKSTMNNGQSLDADVLVTTNSIEPGDSGGAVVNGEGKVVGVVSNLSPNARLQSQFIALTELREFYAQHAR